MKSTKSSIIMMFFSLFFTRNIFCFGKQRTGNDISRHGRKIPANGTDAIRLPIMIYNLKFFTDCHGHSPAFS